MVYFVDVCVLVVVVCQLLFSIRNRWIWLCEICVLVVVRVVLLVVRLWLVFRLDRYGVWLFWYKWWFCLVVNVVCFCVVCSDCRWCRFWVQWFSVVWVLCSVCSMVWLNLVRVVLVLVLVVWMCVWVLDDGSVYEISGLIDYCWVIGVLKFFSRLVVFIEVLRWMFGYSLVVVMLICVVVEVSLCLVWCMFGWCCSSVWLLLIGSGCVRLGVCVQLIMLVGSWFGVFLSSVVSEQVVVECCVCSGGSVVFSSVICVLVWVSFGGVSWLVVIRCLVMLWLCCCSCSECLVMCSLWLVWQIFRQLLVICVIMLIWVRLCVVVMDCLLVCVVLVLCLSLLNRLNWQLIVNLLLVRLIIGSLCFCRNDLVDSCVWLILVLVLYLKLLVFSVCLYIFVVWCRCVLVVFSFMLLCSVWVISLFSIGLLYSDYQWLGSVWLVVICGFCVLMKVVLVFGCLKVEFFGSVQLGLMVLYVVRLVSVMIRLRWGRVVFIGLFVLVWCWFCCCVWCWWFVWLLWWYGW